MLKDRLPVGLKWTVSSADPNKWALTVKGFMVGLAPLVLLLVGYFQIDIGENGWAELTEVVYNTIVALGAMIGGVMTVYGLIRKAYLGWKYRK